MSARLSAPQRVALGLLVGFRRLTAAHTRDGYVSAIVAKALVERGLAEYGSGTEVIVTDKGRAAWSAANAPKRARKPAG